MDETTARVKRVARQPTRQPTVLALWAWAPVTVVRIGLVVMYAVNVYFAIMALLAGVPVFSATTPAVWTPFWAWALIVASVVAATCVSSDDPNLIPKPRWRMAELISSGAVFVLTATYSAALHIVGHILGDLGRQAVGAAVLWGCVLPAVRFLWLASQMGRERGRE